MTPGEKVYRDMVGILADHLNDVGVERDELAQEVERLKARIEQMQAALELSRMSGGCVTASGDVLAVPRF